MDKVCLATMNLISAEICGKEVDADLIKSLNDDELKALYALSKKHDVGHIVGDALIKSRLINNEEVKSAFEKQILTAVYRYEGINAEIEEIKCILEECSVPFILLKGAVIRFLYPEPWQRTSSDVDVLVKQEDVKRCRKAFEERGYKYYCETGHDISYFSPTGIHIELHFTLIETRVSSGENADKLLKKVWSYAVKKADKYEHTQRDEFFYFYYLAHMAKHFCNGGCGLRSFIDLWLLNNQVDFDSEKRREILKSGNLDKFDDNVRLLSRIWFEGEKHNKTTETMERYLLSGGVYGSEKNRIDFGKTKKGSFRYIISRIWDPYDVLCAKFPSLQGKKILLPFYEVCRWLRLLKPGKLKKCAGEVKEATSVSKEKSDEISVMMKGLGL